MGTLSFTGLSEGLTLLTMADNELPAGGWYDNSNYLAAYPIYKNESVEVSAIPVPAAAWLFGSGLIGLIGLARRKACI